MQTKKRKPTPKQQARKMIASILSNFYEESWFEDFEEEDREDVQEAYEDVTYKLSRGQAG